MGIWPLGFVILTQILKFIGGQGYSHYFKYADFNGDIYFEIKAFLGVANRRRKIYFLVKKHEKDIKY